jgi:chromosomal replication initiation ATPase DnaA
VSRARQLALDLGHRIAVGAADFLVAPSNEEAVAWLDRWPDWPAPALVLFGPAGSGKTHLAHVLEARSGALRVAPSALTLETVPALAVAAVIVDPAETAPEQALLHLYNLVQERHGTLLLIGRTAPAQWPLRLADLRSRLLASPAVALRPPDDALLAAVLLKLFADRQIDVGQELIAFLLREIERSFDAARHVVERLDAAALAAGRPVTVPFAREVLRGVR